MQLIPMKEIIKDICKSVKTIDKLNEKSNKQIADLLREHFFSQLEAFSPAADLIEIAIERLESC